MSMPRRSRKNADLPANLYENGDYFRYKHPITGKVKSLKCSRQDAIEAAKVANNALLGRPDLSQHLIGTERDINTLIDGFIEEYIPIRKWRESTEKEARYKLKAYRQEFGLHTIDQITVLTLKNYLSQFKPNAYIKHRQLWIHLFTYAISLGLIEYNAAEATLKLPPPKRSRDRLTDDTYRAIYEKADPWFRNAMELARISLQRRSDLVKMRYADVKDGYLYLTQSKTGANLKIKIWPELQKAIQATRTVPLSPYILHRHSKRRTTKRQRIDNSVTPEFLSKTFAKYAKAAGVENVTFHEIRSYGARQYEKQGIPKTFIQALLGHSTEKMTDVYLEDDVNWIEVKL